MTKQQDFIRQLPNGWWTMRVNGITQKFEYENIHEAYRDYCARAPLPEQEEQIKSMPFSWFPVDKNLDNLPPLRELLKSTGPPILVLNRFYRPVHPMKCNYCGYDGPAVFLRVAPRILHCSFCQYHLRSFLGGYHCEVEADYRKRLAMGTGGSL